MSMKSTKFVSKEAADRKWYVIDATDLVLGRAASQIAMALRGKNKVTFTPHADTGDFVIIVNADKVRLTGNKLADKNYYQYSGFPGGLSHRTANEMLVSRPADLWKRAVWGMLPKNRLGKQIIKKLKVYAGPQHPHEAQKPEALPLAGI